MLLLGNGEITVKDALHGFLPMWRYRIVNFCLYTLFQKPCTQFVTAVVAHTAWHWMAERWGTLQEFSVAGMWAALSVGDLALLGGGAVVAAGAALAAGATAVEAAEPSRPASRLSWVSASQLSA